jgi:hypothetical protein
MADIDDDMEQETAFYVMKNGSFKLKEISYRKKKQISLCHACYTCNDTIYYNNIVYVLINADKEDFRTYCKQCYNNDTITKPIEKTQKRRIKVL